jgi:hypothetical protein
MPATAKSALEGAGVAKNVFVPHPMGLASPPALIVADPDSDIENIDPE